jgi:hypothetical protein
MGEGRTIYSETIPGDGENYHWPATFDYCDGYVGLTQSQSVKGEQEFVELAVQRVLLSRKQVRELLAFIGRNKK